MSSDISDDGTHDDILDDMGSDDIDESLSLDERKARDLEARRKIEERLEERRLRQEIGDLEDLDDWDD